MAAMLLGVTASARAEDDATVAMARERFKEGVAFFDKGLYDKARAAFLQAYALKRHPSVLLNLAQSEVRSGHEADAATHFSQFLREQPDAPAAERKAADSGLAAAKKVAAELSIEVDIEGAEIAADGEPAGTSPLPGPIYLTAGSHTIVAKKDDRQDTVELQVSAGQSTSTTLHLAGSGAEEPAAAAPPAPAPAEPETTEPPEDEPEEPSGEGQSFFAWAAGSPIAWIGGGLAVVGLGGGIGFALSSKGAYDDAHHVEDNIQSAAVADGLPDTVGICRDPVQKLASATHPVFPSDPGRRAQEYQTACASYSDNVDRGDKLKTYSTVGFVVAGVAVVGTVVAYLVDGSGGEESARQAPARGTAIRILPWSTPTQRGLVVAGEF